jgi:peptide deformylase
VSTFALRYFGDPVLKLRAREVEEFDGALARLVDSMVETMYEEHGGGLAAPQVGVQKRLFTYDIGDGPQVLINPVIVESSGECVFEEGCLSVPGLHFEIVRPEFVTVTGRDLAGDEVVIEAGGDYLGRMIQHEIDHLDGILLLDRLDPDERKAALRELRQREFPLAAAGGSGEHRL